MDEQLQQEFLQYLMQKTGAKNKQQLEQKINAIKIYEGEIKKRNRLTGEFELGDPTGDDVVGYMAYFRLENGYEQYHQSPEMLYTAPDESAYQRTGCICPRFYCPPDP